MMSWDPSYHDLCHFCCNPRAPGFPGWGGCDARCPKVRGLRRREVARMLMIGQVPTGLDPLSPILAECIERLQRQRRKVQYKAVMYASVEETQVMWARMRSLDAILGMLEHHRRRQPDHDRGQHRSRSPGGRGPERAASGASSSQVQPPSAQFGKCSIQCFLL